MMTSASFSLQKFFTFAGAQESLEEKVTLKTCEGFELRKVNTIADYQAVANSTESLEKIEECMKVWIKQIEQVRALC